MDFRKGVREWVRWAQWGGVTRRDRLISGGFGRTVRDVWEGRMRSGYTLGGGGTRMGYGRLGAGVQDLGRWVVGVMWPWRLLRAPRGAGACPRGGFRGSGACFGPLRGRNWHSARVVGTVFPLGWGCWWVQGVGSGFQRWRPFCGCGRLRGSLRQVTWRCLWRGF